MLDTLGEKHERPHQIDVPPPPSSLQNLEPIRFVNKIWVKVLIPKGLGAKFLQTKYLAVRQDESHRVAVLRCRCFVQNRISCRF